MPSLAQRFYVDASGRYLGSWTGFKHPDEFALDRGGALILIDGEPVLVGVGATVEPTPPPGAIEVFVPPGDGRDTWDGSKWVPAPAAKKPVTLDDVVKALIKKGAITAADLEGT